MTKCDRLFCNSIITENRPAVNAACIKSRANSFEKEVGKQELLLIVLTDLHQALEPSQHIHPTLLPDLTFCEYCHL